MIRGPCAIQNGRPDCYRSGEGRLGATTIGRMLSFPVEISGRLGQHDSRQHSPLLSAKAVCGEWGLILKLVFPQYHVSKKSFPRRSCRPRWHWSRGPTPLQDLPPKLRRCPSFPPGESAIASILGFALAFRQLLKLEVFPSVSYLKGH